MRSKFLRWLLVGACMVLAVPANVAVAQISLNEATMQSTAFAETDAGPEYSYEISRHDELDSLTTYAFSEYGTAPGYSSQATVGVEHDSEFSGSQISLSGKAYAYVADDYGYAYCSADSQAAAYVTFTLDQDCQVQVGGLLSFAGYPATESDVFFALRKYGQPYLVTQYVPGSVDFDQVLEAGAYQLTVLSRVWLEIDFAGGDVYESSTGNFQIDLTATPVQQNVPEFLNIRHAVFAASSDEDNSDADQVISRKFEQFEAALDVGSTATIAESSLSSYVDRDSGVFWVYGYAASGLYVQGSASSDVSSEFRSDFQLNNAGHIELSGVVGVVDFLGNYVAHDEPGFARVIVRVRDLVNNQNVVNKVITMNGYPPASNQFDLGASFGNVPLSAGRYRLTINALAEDSANNEQVAGSIAVAFLEVEGRIVEDQ